MYARRNYGFMMTFKWSKKPFIYGLIYSTTVIIAYHLLQRYVGIDISIPWQPISILGIAVAFYLGFKNNASYERTWEARKIWGAIVNYSRSFGVAVCSYIDADYSVKKELIYRHIAWLTCLRYQLRLAKEWEHTDERVNGMFIPTICESYFDKIDEELIKYLREEEVKHYSRKSNMASQILLKQSNRLEELYKLDQLELYKQVDLQGLIYKFYDEQGKSERIKAFPFPRQYASTTLWLCFIFSALLPFGLLNVFKDHPDAYLWIASFLSALVIWVFFLMEMIGDYSENPFEGTYNDVPISAISRTIEIDLREMIEDTDIPPPMLPDKNGFLM
jgi:ion channel-forming bestrophin family protein